MSARDEAPPILFEAISSPPRGLSGRALGWVMGFTGLATAIPATLFTLLGAWPVLGFLGGEVVLVGSLLLAYRRWAGTAVETVLLREGQLLVRREGGRGRAEEAVLEPYWTQVRMEERPGQACNLLLVSRGRRVQVGCFLTDAERRDLADALKTALRQYREPRFDNPQLREP